MSTVEEVEEMEIPESDKPFYLALASAILLVIVIFIGAIGANSGNQAMIDYAIQMGTPIFALVGAAWAFYFAKKEM